MVTFRASSTKSRYITVTPKLPCPNSPLLGYRVVVLIPYRAAASMAMAAPTRLPAEAKGAATFELVVVAADFVADPVVVFAEEPVGAAVVEPEPVEAGAEEESAAVVDESEDLVVDESEDSVVLLEAELSDAVAEPVWLEELSLQTTWSGVLTPAEEQIC